MTHLRLYDPSTHTVVPRKPTPDMLDAAYDRWPVGQEPGTASETKEDAAGVFAAMVAAAPDASRPLPTLERLAVEIYNSHCPQTDIVWYLLPDKDKNIYRRIADAALALLEGNGKQ